MIIPLSIYSLYNDSTITFLMFKSISPILLKSMYIELIITYIYTVNPFFIRFTSDCKSLHKQHFPQIPLFVQMPLLHRKYQDFTTYFNKCHVSPSLFQEVPTNHLKHIHIYFTSISTACTKIHKELFFSCPISYSAQ